MRIPKPILYITEDLKETADKTARLLGQSCYVVRELLPEEVASGEDSEEIRTENSFLYDSEKPNYHQLPEGSTYTIHPVAGLYVDRKRQEIVYYASGR